MDKSDLIKELLYSYYDARKNKRNTYNQLSFELKYEKNIISLADQILEKSIHLNQVYVLLSINLLNEKYLLQILEIE